MPKEERARLAAADAVGPGTGAEVETEAASTVDASSRGDAVGLALFFVPRDGRGPAGAFGGFRAGKSKLIMYNDIR